jgi:hypothetical protein
MFTLLNIQKQVPYSTFETRLFVKFYLRVWTFEDIFTKFLRKKKTYKMILCINLYCALDDTFCALCRFQINVIPPVIRAETRGTCLLFCRIMLAWNMELLNFPLVYHCNNFVSYCYSQQVSHICIFSLSSKSINLHMLFLRWTRTG